MKTIYRTSNAFFVSSVGLRLQKQIKTFFSANKWEGLSAVFIGSVAPFLAVFEQNTPEILWESETPAESELLPSFSSLQNVSLVFIVVSNDSVLENMPFLIKEAYRLLASQGRLFILIKNKQRITVKDMPETTVSSLLKLSRESCFSLEKKKGFLHFPYAFKIFETADNFLFSHISGGGAFSLLVLRKDQAIKETNDNYNSVRMTNASVLTSPRT